ncbi:polyketide-type polyunsaturated fatty acid synthase PfaA [Desulfuromusa kysingii]|uniref:Polyketide-type polyunsaturated fatty acid synthase PfaA n=1 Tax=Desulfuromusa kysingii TaxID=37625 RepID=A0A1H4DPE5_9BACT|nr:type I polyketide synthase [Desulfuromusa kysingii]SEA74634.1 polyketide-type polyunsaturated fatty acid synthase PfaA [Desulfuromusa kysingii]
MNTDSGKVKTTHAPANSAPVAIIGIGSMYPQADNTAKFWTNIKNRVDAITEVPASHWRAEDYYDQDPKVADKVYAKLGGFLSPVEFNPMDYGILPNAIEAIDTSQLLGLLTVDQALKDAGYAGEKSFDRDQVSVILGITGTLELVVPLGARLGYPRWKEALADAGVEKELAEDVIKRISDSYVPWQENSFPGLLGNVVAGRISKHFDFGGTNCTVDAACGSSLSAVNLAMLELASGRSDMVVTGGIDTFNDIFMYTCFSKTPALSPSGHARPFDAETDGTTLGEGLGIVVLKRLEDAERDGDNIYAVIKGLGASSDGRGSAIYEPNADGQAKSLLRAYQQGGVTPDTIELIEGHGTGTRVGDAVEVSALHSVFGTAEKPWCALGSIKSQIGHTKAAAGVAGLIKASLALYHKILPPTIKVDHPQKSLAAADTPFYVNTEARPWISKADHPRRAGVSALGFGGSNFHCLLEEYQSDKQIVDWDGEVQIVPFSAADDAGLMGALKDFSTIEDWSQLRLNASIQRKKYQPSASKRLLLVIDREQTDRAGQLKNAVMMLEKNQGQPSWETPDGIFYAEGEFTGASAFLFPGQGAQYPGMLKDLALQFPEFLNAFESADLTFSSSANLPPGFLADKIYPHPQFTPEDQQKAVSALQATEVAQPALGAVSLAAERVMARFGVAADAVAGHSYGELTALCAADVFTPQSLHQLSRLRGELMASGVGDRGSMVAVSAPLEEVESFLREESLDLVLANRNTPVQAVLSGATLEIEKAVELLTRRGISHKKLDVSAAFHSPLIAAAAQPFSERLEKVVFNDSTKNVFSNTTGAAYPGTAAAIKALLADQLASPVNFVSEIEAMYASGVRTFIEVGPGGRLTGMVKAILGHRPYTAIALDSSNGKRSGSYDLARVLAKLAALGMPVRLSLWDENYAATQTNSCTKKRGISVSICGANFYKRPEKRPPLKIKHNQVVDHSLTPPADDRSAAVLPAQQQPSVAPVVNNNLQEALRISQQSMQALQSLQEQTSKLHQQFLEGQQSATRSFMQLIGQQRELLQGSQGSNSVAFVSPSPMTPKAEVAPPAASQPKVAIAAAPSEPIVETPQQAAPTATVEPLLLNIIAEKTGYPVEMLELEMALDSDLGIDSIKRVEILSALQEQLPAAPTIRPEDLGALQTLGQIVDYLVSGMPESTTPPASVSAVGQEAIASVLLAVVAEKTGYPVEMLELEMALDTDLGIDSIKRVEILSALQEQLPQLPAVRPEDLGVLQTLGQIIEHLSLGAAQTVAPITAAVPVAGIDSAAVASALLNVVAEKTGYPVDMLELEMALDTDLGIDSIKRVEILSALQEELPQLPAVRPEDLGVLQTLGQIIDHLCQQADQSETTASAPQSQPPQLGQLDREQVSTVLLDVIAEKTGYPVEMLELDMALDTDLGIDSIKRVEILSTLQERLPGAPAIKPEHLGTMQTVGQIIDFLATISGSEQEETHIDSHEVEGGKGIIRQVLSPVTIPQKRTVKEFSFPAGAEVWITDDGSSLADAVCSRLTGRQLIPRKIKVSEVDKISLPATLAGLVILAPLSGASDQFYRDSFRLLQKVAVALQTSSNDGGSFLVTVSRVNGYFGLGTAETINDALSGGLAGLSKTVALEWPAIHCKALDLAMGMEILSTATAIVDEIFHLSPIEVGISTQGLHALELVSEPLADSLDPVPVGADDLVVISGGGRGVTAEVAVALSASTKATLLLLGRSGVPETEPAWLSGLKKEAEIKKAILAQANMALKPLEVASQFNQIMAAREIRKTLERVTNAGGTAIYRSVDLRQQQAVNALIDEFREQYGPVKGFIHGAGVLADKLITEKTLEQFERVYSTKVEGLRNLLNAIGDDDLKLMVMFSSSTGRFGRVGQIDYAVANEVLNKMADQQAQQRPDCKVLSLNWGPWDGGMVTAALKKVFSQEGIDVIDLGAGSEYLIHELATPTSGPVELVISGGDAESQIEEATEPPQNLCVSKAFDLELDVQQYPFLKSHVMDGKAVLPMAVIIEWLAHGAIHNNPGLTFQGFNDLRILKGVILESQQSLHLQVMTGKAIKGDGVHVVPVELASSDSHGHIIPHARAKIVLASRLPARQKAAEPLSLSSYPHPIGQVYQPERLFHGDDFQGIRKVIGCSDDGISALVDTAPLPSRWIAEPLRNSWLADPLTLDGSFQMLILWGFEQYQAGSLPVYAGRYRQYQQKFPENDVEVRVHIIKQNQQRAIANIDFVDPLSGLLVARLEKYECVIDASLNLTFQRNKLTGVA